MKHCIFQTEHICGCMWPSGCLFATSTLKIHWINYFGVTSWLPWRRQWQPTPVLLPGKSHGWKSLEGWVYVVAEGQTRLSDFTFTFHFHALEKEMATHSSVLAWRIPGTGEPGGLPSMGSHRVGHDWSDLAAAAAKHCSQRTKCCLWRSRTSHAWTMEKLTYGSLYLQVNADTGRWLMITWL